MTSDQRAGPGCQWRGMDCKVVALQCSSLLPDFLKSTLISGKDEMAHCSCPCNFSGLACRSPPLAVWPSPTPAVWWTVPSSLAGRTTPSAPVQTVFRNTGYITAAFAGPPAPAAPRCVPEYSVRNTRLNFVVTGTEEKRLLPLVVVGCTVITAFRRCRRSRETRRTYSQAVLAEVPGEREGFPVDNGGMGVREDVRYSGGTPVVPGTPGALPGISHRCFADTRWRQHTLGAQFLGDLSRFQAGHAHLKDALYLVTNVIKLSVLCIND